MRLALPEHFRARIGDRLPADAEVAWYAPGGLDRAASGAEALWLDYLPAPRVRPLVEAAAELRWLATGLAGVDGWPLDLIAERGIVLTNGSGLNAKPVAEFAVMGLLAMAKDLRALVHAQDRREFLARAPGNVELEGTRALVIGYGAIGREIGRRLKAFDVEITGVRRRPDGEPGVIGPGDWRARLGEFDWIVLAAAATRETAGMIGRAELSAMKPSAVIVNIARGELIDQGALVEALTAERLGGAFLDVTDPEPSPPDDPIWTAPRTLLTSHCAGRAQTHTADRNARFFLDNLERWRAGRPLANLVDLRLGY
jgi:phosphoglycerate dehydrogenase-like enzyme